MINYLLIGVALAGMSVAGAFFDITPDYFNLFDDDTPSQKVATTKPVRGWLDLQGNRGARGNRPENTLPAFEFGYESQMTTLSFEVNLTKDNQLIIYHSPWIDEELCLHPNGEEARDIEIIQTSLADLKALNCGSVIHDDFPEQVTTRGARLMTLDELFTHFSEKAPNIPTAQPIRFNMRMVFADDYGDEHLNLAANLLVETIKRYNLIERTTVQSFELKLLPLIKKRDKRILTSAMFAPTGFQALRLMLGLDANRMEIVSEALGAGADVMSPQYLYVNSEFVQFCHDQKLMVIPWTVNDEKAMTQLFDDGVDGMVSDYPERLLRTFLTWRDLNEK